MHLLCSFVHKGTFQDEYCKFFSGGSRPSDKVGEGGGPFAPQFGGLKVRERRGPRPSPLDPPLLSYFVCEHYCLVPKKKTKEKEDVKPFNIDFIGRLVGGHETLNAMERVECDEKDRPKVNEYRIQFNSCLFR